MDPGFYNHERKKNPQAKANCLSIFTFWWLRELFTKGYQKKLELNDIYMPLDHHLSEKLGNEYETMWEEELKNSSPSLLRIIFKINGFRYMIVTISYSIAETTLRIMRPILLGLLVSYFSPNNENITKEQAYLYATGVVVSMILNVFMLHPFFVEMMITSMKVRLGCSSLIYRKLLRMDVKSSSKGENLGGRLINLLSNDAHQFDMCSNFLVELWRAPIEGLICTCIMYVYVGPDSLIGIAFLLCFIPLQGWLSNVSANYRRKAASETDYRIKMMNEVIQGIQIIKMYAWERCFANIVNKIRKNEMKFIGKISWIKALMICFVNLNTRISIFITILPYVLLGNQLTASKVFVLFALYGLIKMTVVEFFPMALMFTMDAKVSVKRIQDFLLLPEKSENKYDTESSEDKILMDDVTVELGDSKDFNFALEHVSLKVQSSELVAIIGQVGCGKSILLQTIIEEIPLKSGILKKNGVISYCSQIPWIFEASIRKNILFGQKMDKKRYDEVVRCCQLNVDFASFSHGDETIIGERGVSLSGGQKARISLARCIYREADVYLLDDPLSAVDANVAKLLMKDCIGDFLKFHGVVLVTHQISHLESADKIVVMESGKIIYQDNYKNFLKSPHYQINQSFIENEEFISNNEILEAEKDDSIEISFDSQTKEEEIKKSGSVGWDAYKLFVKSGSNSIMLLIMALIFCLGQISYSMCDLWLSRWVDIEEGNISLDEFGEGTECKDSSLVIRLMNYMSISHDDSDISSCAKRPIIYDGSWNTNKSIYLYSGLIAATIILTLTKLIMYFNVCIRASIKLHDSLFRSITRTKMFFFYNNTTGRILNRFSKDMGTVDTVLPGTMIDCISFFLETIGIIIVVCIIKVWLLIPTALIIVLLYIIRTIHLSTSRNLKRLEATSRSPAYTHADASLKGLDTIRSASIQNTLIKEFDKFQDLHTSIWSLIIHTNRAFSFWMDIVCCIYLALVTYSFLVFYSEDDLGGQVGLAITSIMSLVGMCQWGLRQTADAENQMTSVERIIEYVGLPSEPPLETDKSVIKQLYPNIDIGKWPTKGDIKMKNVSLTYDQKYFALNNLTLNINHGEKVGIVGRTGAGKSSFITALFRLNEISGSIAIDGIKTDEVGLHPLRTSMSVIPQDPVLFSGSLRENLDPWNKYTDVELWNALEEVELKNFIVDLGEKLEVKIIDGGSNFSVGQRQLLCLTRAILRKSQIILLDEATANIDSMTDSLIQKTIRKKFATQTVITIAHRLHTVMDSDRIIVMEEGNAIQSGHPYELITEDGIFKQLVEQSGKNTSNELLKIAKENYTNNESKKSG